MRKYVAVAKLYFKAQLVWRVDVIFNMILTVLRIMFAWLLWRLIFTGKNEISGFTFHSMLSYYIVSSFLTQLEMSKRIGREINQRIRNGTFSRYMVIPVNVEGYFTAMEAGIVLFYITFDLAVTVLWTAVFRIRFTFTDKPFVIVCAGIMILLGLFFMVQLNFFLGLLTLKYQGIDTFLMIKNQIIALVCGSIIPLALFPEEVVNLMRLLPFYYVTYLPSMLLVGYCENEAVSGIFILTGWCVLMQFVLQLTWRTYIRKYDGVGI